jgi:precorrin-6B methylase 2
MNENILNNEVQRYITEHINADVNKIALSKSLFKNVSSAELAGQIAAKKKSIHKLPTWFNHDKIYYPVLLSIEQCSSETTAAYKANLAIGSPLIDLTAGFGVDSYFFSEKVNEVYSCEINPELLEITAYNAKILGANNINFVAEDGIEFLKKSKLKFDTIYIDPARRSHSNKVFKLKDCTPDITEHLALFLEKAQRIIIKTAPLLDISAGLNELQNVSEIHIVSVKNECKELLWIIDKNFVGETKIVCATLNTTTKTFSFSVSDLQIATEIANSAPAGYLYEPDVALLKSGAFNLIAERFGLKKLHQQSQLYFSEEIKSGFLGRIFEIKALLNLNELKKEKELKGNVIVRNFPEKAENLVKKYKISSSNDDFILFTQTNAGYLVIKAKIIQHY